MTEFCCKECGSRNFHRIERIEVDDVGCAVAFIADAQIFRCAACTNTIVIGDDGTVRAAVEADLA